MNVKPKFLATGVGSMPFDDPCHGIDLLIAALPDAPFWPQLPRKGLHEQMEIQFCEGMPRAVIDEGKNRLYFDTSGDYSEELADFYGTYMAAMDPDEGNGDCSALAIGPSFSSGIYALDERLRQMNRKLPFVKVQVTGPCTFSLTVNDENRRAVYYNEEFRDVVLKALAMKCRWQIQKFKPYADHVICFIDEPILSAFGSSTYVSVKREDVVALLTEMIGAVHADGGIAGIHCCGNTEWSIPIDAGVDIVNFDAFQYGETVAMYPAHVKNHLERGGMLAWGVVPTSAAIGEQTVEGLAERLEGVMAHLAAKGIEKRLIADQALITPSCGTGSMSPADAEHVFRLTGELSREMKRRYGF
jgi:hypothetical protein